MSDVMTINSKNRG